MLKGKAKALGFGAPNPKNMLIGPGNASDYVDPFAKYYKTEEQTKKTTPINVDDTKSNIKTLSNTFGNWNTDIGTSQETKAGGGARIAAAFGDKSSSLPVNNSIQLSAGSVTGPVIGIDGAEDKLVTSSESDDSKVDFYKDRLLEYYEDSKNMRINEFDAKYVNGAIAQYWSNELLDLNGKEEYEKFISSALKAGNEKEEEPTDNDYADQIKEIENEIENITEDINNSYAWLTSGVITGQEYKEYKRSEAHTSELQ